MVGFLRKLIKGLGIAAAVVVILLALAVGGFRLLMAQLPEHQARLQAWVSDELGLGLAFERVDARWGLGGPELVFRDASLAAGGVGGEEMFSARQAALSFSAVALLDRRLGVKRLVLEGTELTLVRRPDGGLSIRGVGTTGDRAPFDLSEIPAVRLTVRDANVRYVDERTGSVSAFAIVRAELQRSGDDLTLDARAEFPGRFATTLLELSIVGRGVTALGRKERAWEVFAAFEDADLAALGTALVAPPIEFEQGHGDLSVWLDVEGGRLVRITADLDLADLRMRTPGKSETASYARAAGLVEWSLGERGWQLAIGGLELSRDRTGWPRPARLTLAWTQPPGAALTEASLSADFLRLEELQPLATLLPVQRWREQWLMAAPRGDMSDVALELRRAGERWDFSVAGQFTDLGFAGRALWPDVAGLSGEVRATQGNGRITLASRDAEVDWPGVMRAPLTLRRLEGSLVWRQGRAGYRLVSDDLVAVTPELSARSNLELTLPQGGGSPRAELEAEISEFEVTAIKRYFPVGRMPARVTQWLDAALVSGRVPGARVSLFGPLDAFPFLGNEGQFRVDFDVIDGALAYHGDWPVAEDIDASIQFLNTSLAARGRARIASTVSESLEVTIPDLRAPTIGLRTTTYGPLVDILGLLRDTPPLARRLGELTGIAAMAGEARLDIDLGLPLGRVEPPVVTAALDLQGAALAVPNVVPPISELNGRLVLRDGLVSGSQLRGILFDGPVAVSVRPSETAGYRSELDFDGELAADALLEALGLPSSPSIAGTARWEGRVRLPAVTEPRAPFVASIASNLAGIALRYPAPLRKAPGEPMNLKVDARVGATRGLLVEGHLGASRRFALAFESPREGGLRFDRGELRFGGDLPALPAEQGLRLAGHVPSLSFDEWSTRERPGTWGQALGGALLESRLEIAEFVALGQQLGQTELRIVPETDVWQVDIASEPVAGTLVLPRGGMARAPIHARMQRLYLESGGRGPITTDPRSLPGLLLEADEFAIDGRRFGQFSAEVRPDPLGLRVASFESHAKSFELQGSGSWLRGAQGAVTRLAFTLASPEISTTLAELGFDPIATAEQAEISGSVYWQGGPGDDWSKHLNGDLALRAVTGSLPDVQPGAGRVMGLMSVAALPRRLALDFRDVFNRGLVFDELAGDFVIVDGNAYTDNFKLTGPAAEIGIVGRTGLRDRDYGQQVVVTAEPGNMLPTVGGLIAGPGVGAALLIFTQIFKEPLKGIGRASYCVGGTWDNPAVERLSPADLAAGRLCADLPPQELTLARP